MILTPFLKLLTEIDLLIEEGIKLPNGMLDYSKFTNGPRKKIDIEKLKKLKSNFKDNEMRSHCTDFIIPINNFKTEVRAQIKTKWEEEKTKLEALGREKKQDPRYGPHFSKPINSFTLIRLMHDYKHSLVHLACRKLSQSVVENALKVEMMHVTHKELLPRINYFAGFGPEQHIFKIEDSHPTCIDHPFLLLNDIRAPSLEFDKLHI